MSETIINDVLGFLDTKRKEIKPEYIRGGKPVYSLRNYADMTDLDAEVLLNGGAMNVAERIPTIGRTGNLLRTPRHAYATNVEIAFDNRVHVTEMEIDGKKKQVYVFVIDQRALMEQYSGHIYSDFVIGYVIGKGKEAPEVVQTLQISERDFINDYRDTFDPTAMEDIMEIINSYRIKEGDTKVITELKF